jgi:hypothetical protein
MESVLIVVTVASLAMTIVLAGILVRLIRDERRRSNARVALLREVADEAAWQYQDPDPADEVDLTPAAASPAAPDLFVRAEPRSAWPRRAAVAATIASLAGLIAVALPSRSPSPVMAGPSNATSASPQTTAMLELLSLGQTQDAAALTITGLVQNPRNGAELSKIKATALLFGPEGNFLASGGAPLDFTVLRPGDESGFVIRVPVTSPVARYRVGFRSEDGRVIGHIDRRSAATMAVGRDSSPAPADRHRRPDMVDGPEGPDMVGGREGPDMVGGREGPDMVGGREGPAGKRGAS